MCDSMPPGCGKKKSLTMAMLYRRRVMLATGRTTDYEIALSLDMVSGCLIARLRSIEHLNDAMLSDLRQIGFGSRIC